MKKRLKYIPLFLIIVCLLIAFWDTPFKSREAQVTTDSYAVYYLLNIDGMKGLGHSAFMLTDETGSGQIFSYNGMQNSLWECLAGKAGVGKMKVFSLSAEEVRVFLHTGNLQEEDPAECDNFDRMLYRYISQEEYERILDRTTAYINTGTEFEVLYATVCETSGAEKTAAEKKLNDFLNQENLLTYQIYTHNCDTVARQLIALVDEDINEYNTCKEKLTPTSNYIGMYKTVSETWGYCKLGQDTLIERVFWQ